jgi:hypothetical protein
MKKSIMSILVLLLSAVMFGSLTASFTDANPQQAQAIVGLFVIGAFALSFMPQTPKLVYSLVYSPAQFTGEYYEEIFNEILYMNKTIEKGLVRLMDNVNTQMVLTESNVTRTTQAYKASPVTADAVGSLTLADKILKPYQFMIYDEFTPNDVLLTRLGKPNSGSTLFPKVTDEYQRLIIARYGAAEAELMESRFWNGATTATKTAVAALTAGTGQNAVGTAEKSYVAAAPTDFIDGVLTKLILTFSVTKRRIKVAGTAITASNIATEYGKVYAAILPKLLQPNYAGDVRIYSPLSHMQLINVYNLNATYRDLFSVIDGGYSYSGVPIEFVPLPENAIIAGKGSDLVWGCDIEMATGMVKMDFLSNNSEDMFIKAPYTMESSFVQAQQFVVYLG